MKSPAYIYIFLGVVLQKVKPVVKKILSEAFWCVHSGLRFKARCFNFFSRPFRISDTQPPLHHLSLLKVFLFLSFFWVVMLHVDVLAASLLS